MRKSTIWRRQIIYEAKVGVHIRDFFEDIIEEMNNNCHDEAVAFFNETLVKIKATDKPAEVHDRWNKERKRKQL